MFPLQGKSHLVVPDFFPRDLLHDLITIISNSETRRLEYDLREISNLTAKIQTVSTASILGSEKLGLKFNFAILKWYRLADQYESEAYRAHRDPIQFRSIPLVLITLAGKADLSFWEESGEEIVVKCKPNQAILLEPNLVHAVSPPENTNERLYMFLGFNEDFEATKAGEIVNQ